MSNKKIIKKFTIGKSHVSLHFENGIIIKKINKNHQYIRPLKILLEHNFSFIPNYLYFDNNTLKYPYIIGKNVKKVNKLSKSNLIILANFLRQVNDVFIKNNEYYAHGDISPTNLIFDKNKKLISIID